MAMRAQLSLVFHDEDLYNQFILPKKIDKELHSIVIKCLTSYFYDEEVRNKIEGVSESTFTPESNKPKSDEELFGEIRGILAMQSILCGELENTMEDGLDEINDIMSDVNSSMRSKGAQEGETEYGTKVFALPQLNSESIKEQVRTAQTSKEQPKKQPSGAKDEAVDLILEYLGTQPDFAKFMASKVEPVKEEPPVVEETPILEVEPKVELAMEEELVVFEEPTVPEEVKDNDASNALRETFGSLFAY